MRPRSIPADDVFDDDLITVITRNPQMVIRGNAGPLKILGGNLFLAIAVAGEELHIEVSKIERIERHRKTKLGRECLPSQKEILGWPTGGPA